MPVHVHPGPHVPTSISRRAFLAGTGAGILGLAAGPVLLGACGSGGTTTENAQPRVKLLDTANGTANGLFKPLVDREGFADAAGVTVDWVGGEPSQAQTSLISGAMDVGAFGIVGVALAENQGHPIRLIAPSLNGHVKWIAKGNSSYSDIGDLRGRRIGTLQETTGTYQATMMTAELEGIDFKGDFDVTTGAPPAIFALFERGDLDAIATTEPGATRLVAAGAKEIANVNEMWKTSSGVDADLPLVGYAATQDWVDENPDTHAATVEVIRAANGYLADDPTRIRAFAEAMGVEPDDDATIELLPERMGYVWSAEWDPATTFAAFDRQLELARQVGIVSSVPAGPLYLPVPT